uniref:C2H2-type domain-containing protein n=1 Tax=Anopheles farauti TaxID=69004 RepID=A0A182QX51_9DIPT
MLTMAQPTQIVQDNKIYIPNADGGTIIIEVLAQVPCDAPSLVPSSTQPGTVKNERETSQERYPFEKVEKPKKKRRKIQKIKKEPTEYRCVECDSVFLKVGQLNLHMKEHISYKCNECGSVFLKRYLLNKHLKNHVTEKDYACSLCGKASILRSIREKSCTNARFATNRSTLRLTCSHTERKFIAKSGRNSAKSC